MADRPFTVPMMQELFTNHELLVREAARPRPGGRDAVRRVGILGGGTAGWLTALDAGASGLDLRLVDGGGESTVTRARYVTADRVCAAGGKPAVAELRALSGRADALVVVRASP
jgi:hypothetical protein